MCAGICGCGQKEKNQTPEDGTYRIYYLNSTRTKLASVEYKTETTDQETLIGELAGQILERRSYFWISGKRRTFFT